MTDPSIASIVASTHRLTALAESLSTGLQAQIVKGARVQNILLVVVGAVALVAAALVAQVHRIGVVSDLVRGNTDSIAAIQTRTSKEVLCPLYGVFLQSYQPDSPQALDDPDRYERAFVVIEAGAETLACDRTVRGP